MTFRRKAGAAALIVVVLATCWAPIWFMFVVASRDAAAATTFPPPVFPGAELPANVARVLALVPLGQALVNSFIVSTAVAAGGAVVCAWAGYAFAKLRFRGRRTLFAAVVVGLTLPLQFAVIPSYLLVSRLGWTDSLHALVVPGLASAFGVLWMRQHIVATLPDDTLDAAKLDGCGPWQTFHHIAVPLIRPGVAVLAGILFVSTWSDVMWPFIVVRSPMVHTAQVALRALQGEYGSDYSLVFTGALLTTAPAILLTILGARWILGPTTRLRGG